MVYGTDTGVTMIVRIDGDYADALIVKHPEIHRPKFPKGANWYYIPIDGAFDSKEAVYEILNAAREFVANQPEPKTKKPAIR